MSRTKGEGASAVRQSRLPGVLPLLQALVEAESRFDLKALASAIPIQPSIWDSALRWRM